MLFADAGKRLRVGDVLMLLWMGLPPQKKKKKKNEC